VVQIGATNALKFYAEQDGLSVAAAHEAASGLEPAGRTGRHSGVLRFAARSSTGVNRGHWEISCPETWSSIDEATAFGEQLP
jgi:hypothetical protein